jgi:hypothetical protein
MDKKYCLGCKTNLCKSLFNKNKREEDGLQNRCKNCKSTQHYINLSTKDEWCKKFIEIFNLTPTNPIYFLEKFKEFKKWKFTQIQKTEEWKLKNQQRKKINKQQTKINNKKRYQNDPHYRQKIKDKVKDWENQNKDRKNKRSRNYYNNNIDFKLKINLRTIFNLSLKGKIKNSSVLKLIGCNIDELKTHIEKQFYNGMNWNNWGEVWEIDHIKPICSFDFTDANQQKECFHHTNLQPLFKTTEISKKFGCKDCVGNRNKGGKYKL